MSELGLERLEQPPVITRILAQPDGEKTLDLIRRTVAKGCDNAEIGHFLELCAAYGLDPFAREAWCAKDTNKNRLLIMVGRDGLRKIVQRNGGEMEGDVVREQDTFAYLRMIDDNGYPFHEVTHKVEAFDRGAILGAWARVYERATKIERGFFVAALSEYMPANVSGYSPWSKQTSAMILAAAERQAARQATPLGGLLIEGEDESINATQTLAVGEGDGSGPGWSGLSEQQVMVAQMLLERAKRLGHEAFPDEATMQMRLSGQRAAVIDGELQAWINELDTYASIPDAEQVEMTPEERIDVLSKAAMAPAPEPEGEQGTLG